MIDIETATPVPVITHNNNKYVLTYVPVSSTQPLVSGQPLMACSPIKGPKIIP